MLFNKRSSNVQNSVYTALRTSIINLNLVPGALISEKEVSLRYQVSRTPVREAFIQLCSEGLIRVIPQKGTSVSLVDFHRVKQEFFLRESLEISVLDRFLQNSGAADFRALAGLVELQEQALKKNALLEFIDYDDRFHRTFFETAEQGLSWEVLDSMCGHYHRVRLLTTWIQDIAENILLQHRKILSALKRKDLDRAKILLSAHLHKLDVEEHLLRERFPDYFARNEDTNLFGVDFNGPSLVFLKNT